MGYNNENADVLVYDHETLANPAFVPEAVSAPSNYKDEAKIAEYISNNLQTQRDKAALDIFGNQIITFGYWTAMSGVQVVTTKTLAEEKLALAALAVVISNNGHRRRIITMNGLNFDLANVIIRAMFHELQFPLHVFDIVPKYREQPNDLMEILTFGGRFAKRSLDFYCKFFSIDPPAPDEVKAIKGADVARLVAEDRWDLVAEHCRLDVMKTLLLAKRVGAFHDAKRTAIDPGTADEDLALF